MAEYVHLMYKEDFRRFVCVQLAIMKTGEALESYTKDILQEVCNDSAVQGLPVCNNGCSQQLPKHLRSKYVFVNLNSAKWHLRYTFTEKCFVTLKSQLVERLNKMWQ